MLRLPTSSPRTDSLFPYTSLCRSPPRFLSMENGHLNNPTMRSEHASSVFAAYYPLRTRIATTHARNSTRDLACGILLLQPRSEEHTSELQSLMRISYAVLCLKNKNHTLESHIHRNKCYVT